METRPHLSLLLWMLLSTWMPAGCQDVCQPCQPSNPLPEGNLEGEPCSEDGASCHADLYCHYRRCRTYPIYPPPKEFSRQTTSPFSVGEETVIVLPPNPSATDHRAGRLIQDQIAESHGLHVSMRPYAAGDPPQNSIVLGSPAGNPAIATLLQGLDLQIPQQGPSPAENFVLKVVSTHIAAAGQGDRGVLHAAQGLKQYIRGLPSTNPARSLPAMTLRDFPDTEMRAFLVLLANYPFDAERRDGFKYMSLPFSMETARAYLHFLSEFRFNTVILQMGDMVAWQHLPQPQDTAISVEDFLGLVREANEYGLETIPLLNASSAHYGWIGTTEEPAAFTEEYVLKHNAEHLAIYLALVHEIAQDYEGVQPLRFFHAGLDEDWSLGLRPVDLHLQWVGAIYDEITSHGAKMMIWHDNWTGTQHFLTSGQNYPDMWVLVWDYQTPIQTASKTAIGSVLGRGLEAGFCFWGNGVPSDFQWWSSLQNPLQKGFVGVHWVHGTVCKEPTNPLFEKVVFTYMYKHAQQFWNAQHLE